MHLSGALQPNTYVSIWQALSLFAELLVEACIILKLMEGNLIAVNTLEVLTHYNNGNYPSKINIYSSLIAFHLSMLIKEKIVGCHTNVILYL